MLERLIQHINAHDGVRWATFDEIADDFIGSQSRGPDPDSPRRHASILRPRISDQECPFPGVSGSSAMPACANPAPPALGAA